MQSTAQAWRARRDGRGLVVVVLNDGRVGMGFVPPHPVIGQAQGGGVHAGVSIGSAPSAALSVGRGDGGSGRPKVPSGREARRSCSCSQQCDDGGAGIRIVNLIPYAMKMHRI